MPSAIDHRLGIDVGGTNTDAVILDGAGRLIAQAKSPTTPDVASGIAAAVDAVTAQPGVERSRLSHAMLGTTQTTNALLERRGLLRTAALRIGSPAGGSVPPLYGWPADLRDAVVVASAVVDGGYEYDGREIVPFDADAVRRHLEALPERPDAVAITGIFSPLRPDQELAAAEIVGDVLGDVGVSLSSRVGFLGLLERENATVLNAALTGAAREALAGLEHTLSGLGLDAEIMFAQNDGTLMTITQALQAPVLTIGSGPANSVRGAAHLSDRGTALVMDIGGTSTDVGALINGYPRESYEGRDIGGVRTNFRVPDVVTIALGGGTVVTGTPEAPVLGPRSVGYRLLEEALVFGGSTPTLTDAAVWAGRAELGDRAAAEPHARLLEAAIAAVDERLAGAVDQMKTSRADITLITVGGGSILAPAHLPGVAEIIEAPHHDVANAVGAATASAGGEVDTVIETDGDRDALIGALKVEARERAVQAGAVPELVTIVEVDEIPLTYMFSPTSRVRVRAAGPIAATA